MKDIRWRRAIVAGFVANVASFVIGGGGYVLVGRLVFPLEPASIWRWTPARMFDLSAGWWVYLVIGNTLLAVAVAVGYAMLRPALPGRGIAKGMWYGLFVYVVGVLPSVFTIHVLTVMNGWAVLYFTIQSFFEHQAYGAIVAAVYGEPGSADVGGTLHLGGIGKGPT